MSGLLAPLAKDLSESEDRKSESVSNKEDVYYELQDEEEDKDQGEKKGKKLMMNSLPLPSTQMASVLPKMMSKPIAHMA